MKVEPAEAISRRSPSRDGHRLIFANQLRGLAALSVVFGHMIAVYWGPRDVVAAFTATPIQPGPPSSLYPLIVHPWLNLGPFGVATFFLISGLVVPISLDSHSRLTFLVARAFRIFPTFVAGASLCLGIVWLNSRFWELPFPPGFDVKVIGGTLFLAQDYLGVADFTLVAWTLCIELKFYIVVAVFAPAIRRGSVSILFAIAFAALAMNVAWTSPSLQPWLEDWPQIGQAGLESTCIVFMLIGVSFHYHLRGVITTPMFFVSVFSLASLYLICSFVGPLSVEYPVTPANYGYALTLFSIIYAFRRFMRPLRPLDFLASVSFPLYVVHSLLGYSALKFFMLYLGLGYRLALVFTIALALGCATLLHRTVERWSIAVGKRIGKRRASTAVSNEPSADSLEGSISLAGSRPV